MPDPDQRWQDSTRQRAFDIAAEVFEGYERRSRTGRALRWQITRADLLSDLDQFLTADERYRLEARSRPERVEWAFGTGAETDPVRVDLGDGRQLKLSGRADRVDRAEDGRVLVFDYKTGKADRYRALDVDAVGAGTKLQLGLYAQAALAHLGADRAAAYYWFISSDGGFKQHGYDWDQARQQRLVSVVSAITTGIEQGVFSAVPGEWNHYFAAHEGCRYCPFDRVCPRERSEMADAKAADPRLAIRAALNMASSP